MSPRTRGTQKLLTPAQRLKCTEIAKAGNDTVNKRATVLLAIDTGKSRAETAELTGFSLNQIHHALTTFRLQGMEMFGPPKRRGRPAGSTKKTTARKKPGKQVTAGKRRGRPKAVKKSATGAKPAVAASKSTAGKKPGRPKAATKTAASEKPAAATAKPAAGKRPGRPAGSTKTTTRRRAVKKPASVAVTEKTVELDKPDILEDTVKKESKKKDKKDKGKKKKKDKKEKKKLKKKDQKKSKKKDKKKKKKKSKK